MNKMQNVFILGNPRSGTSLFRLLLNAHSRIVVPPESGFSHWWLNKYKDWKPTDSQTPRIDEFILDVLSSKKIETWELDKNKLLKTIINANPLNYMELINTVYLSFSNSKSEIQVIADKNNYYINHLNDLLDIWPNAKFIHLVRDGRDVACSYIKVNTLNKGTKYIPKLSVKIEEIANEWSNNLQKIDSFFQKRKKPDVHTLRYEDLVVNPKETLDDCCAFLEQNYEPTMLAYFENNDKQYTEPEATIAWKQKTKEAIDSQNIMKYKKELSKQDIELFNKIASMQLKKYNYMI
jgi:hypothetical protein